MKIRRTPEQEVSAGLARVLRLLGTKRDTSALRDRYGRGLTRLSKEGRISPDQKSAVAEVFDLLASIKPVEPAVKRGRVVPLVKSLVTLRLPDVAEVVFARCLAEDMALSDKDVIPAVPTVAAMGALLKRRKTAKAWVLEQAAKRPDEIYPTPVAEYAIRMLDARSTTGITRLAIAGHPRPGHLTSPELLADEGLRRDVKAEAFHAVVEHAQRPEQVAFRYWRLLSREPNRLLAASDHVTSRYIRGRAQKTDELLLKALAQVALSNTGETSGALTLAVARARASIAATSVGRNWIPDEQVAAALSEASRIAGTRILQGTKAGRPVVWSLMSDSDQVSGQPSTRSVPVAIDDAAASLVARSARRVALGEPAEPIMEALAHNVGMERIGSAGASAAYDPLQHEVKSGDVLPGETVLIETSGWKLGKRVVLRALARPQAGL